MKVQELLEAKSQFTVRFSLGRHKREQKFTSDSIRNCKIFSPGEIRSILKLEVSATLNTSSKDDVGRTMVLVTRTK